MAALSSVSCRSFSVSLVPVPKDDRQKCFDYYVKVDSIRENLQKMLEEFYLTSSTHRLPVSFKMEFDCCLKIKKLIAELGIYGDLFNKAYNRSRRSISQEEIAKMAPSFKEAIKQVKSIYVRCLSILAMPREIFDVPEMNSIEKYYSDALKRRVTAFKKPSEDNPIALKSAGVTEADLASMDCIQFYYAHVRECAKDFPLNWQDEPQFFDLKGYPQRAQRAGQMFLEYIQVHAVRALERLGGLRIRPNHPPLRLPNSIQLANQLPDVRLKSDSIEEHRFYEFFAKDVFGPAFTYNKGILPFMKAIYTNFNGEPGDKAVVLNPESLSLAPSEHLWKESLWSLFPGRSIDNFVMEKLFSIINGQKIAGHSGIQFCGPLALREFTKDGRNMIAFDLAPSFSGIDMSATHTFILPLFYRNHWTLLTILKEEDSAISSVAVDDFISNHDDWFRPLGPIISEWFLKATQLTLSPHVQYELTNHDVQKNQYDCGAYVYLYAYLRSGGKLHQEAVNLSQYKTGDIRFQMMQNLL